MALKDSTKTWIRWVSDGADTMREVQFKAGMIREKLPLDTFLLKCIADFNRLGPANVHESGRFYFTEKVEEDVKANMRESVRVAADSFGYIAFSDDKPEEKGGVGAHTQN